MINCTDHRELELKELHQQREELLLSQKPYNMNFHPLPDDTTHLLSSEKNKARLREGIDNVNHPDHYTKGGIECIAAIEAALTPEEFRGYLKGNVLKYNWRCNHKNGVEDLKKAQWYLNKLIAEHDATH